MSSRTGKENNMAIWKTNGEQVKLIGILADGFVYNVVVVERNCGTLLVLDVEEFDFAGYELHRETPYDALPPGYIRLKEMVSFGVRNRSMLPITPEQAANFFPEPIPVYRLSRNATVRLVENAEEISEGKDEMYGITVQDWYTYIGRSDDGKIVRYDENEQPIETAEPVQSAADAALLAEYRRTGLSPDDLNEVADLFRSIPDADIPAEIKGWVARGAWQARRCAELEKKLQLMEMELTQLHVREAKTLKVQLIDRLSAEKDRIVANIFDEVDGGGEAAVKHAALASANQIALLNAIIHVFIHCDLQYIQCRELARIPEKISIIERLYLTLLPENGSSNKLFFGEKEIQDAIFDMIAKLGV